MKPFGMLSLMIAGVLVLMLVCGTRQSSEELSKEQHFGIGATLGICLVVAVWFGGRVLL